MDINGNLKTPCNIYGICGCKQSGEIGVLNTIN